MKNYKYYQVLLESKLRVAEEKEQQLKLAEKQLSETLNLIEALFKDGEECVIEVKEDGRWRMVGIDKNDPRGFSTEPSAQQGYSKFESKKAARSSGIYKRLLNSKDLVEDKDFRINSSDGKEL